MKKYAVWTMVGLMCMAPASFAQEANPSGPETTTVDTKTKKTSYKKMAKGKKVKPLTAQEQKELDNIKDSSKEPNASGEERAEVK